MRPKAILFDIGSTLWSSPPEDAGALAFCYGRGREALLSCLREVPDRETLARVVEGMFADWEERWKADASLVLQEPTSEFVARALASLGLQPPPEALALFTDAVLETSVYTAKVEPAEPGMRETLETLCEMGFSLACVSNAFMGAGVLDRILEERGLRPHCLFTVSSCEVGYRKPHPAIYEAALDRLGIAGSEAVFVGDRLDADVEGPAALGMRTVLTHQYRQEDPTAAKVRPNHVIRHLSELVPLAEALLGEHVG
jgi:HAD superfamily hydrolase (TIGR01509 family)